MSLKDYSWNNTWNMVLISVCVSFVRKKKGNLILYLNGHAQVMKTVEKCQYMV